MKTERPYRHYSAAQLDSAFVRISLKVRKADKGYRVTDTRGTVYTAERIDDLRLLLVKIDEERDIKEGIS